MEERERPAILAAGIERRGRNISEIGANDPAADLRLQRR
jgi:hypothetical protein